MRTFLVNEGIEQSTTVVKAKNVADAKKKYVTMWYPKLEDLNVTEVFNVLGNGKKGK